MVRARAARVKPRRGARVGETVAAEDFFAGRYAKVAAETFDRSSMDIDDADIAFAVGALTFLARFDDALAAFDAWRIRTPAPDTRTLAASRFFLGVACARSGDFRRAHGLLVARARARIRAAEPWSRAFVFQGLACHRYFTGRYRAAARHASRALRAAVAARLPYVQMLSTDLRGHALVQLGLFQAGTALLEQAKSHASRLGLGENAFAIACSIAIYRAKTKCCPEALGDLETLLARRAHDSYSRRMLHTQAAVQLALRGRATDARAALHEADRDALQVDARRAKVSTLIARLHLQRVAHGPAACAELLAEATALTADGDVAFLAEIEAFQLLVARSLGDLAGEARALRALGVLRARSEHHAITTALRGYEERERAFAEDEVAPLLQAAAAHDTRALGRMFAQGILGLVPETCGLSPGRHVTWLAAENALVVSEHGDVFVRPGPPRWVEPLLRALAPGNTTKARILAELWGLRRYQPERHDSLVRTTIHRLRTWLEPRGHWVAVTEDGYGLTVPLHVVGAMPGPAHHDVTLLDVETMVAAPPMTTLLAPPLPAPGADDAVAAALAGGAAMSVTEIARVTSLSASTVLRRLRVMVAERRVTCTGYARATRYRVR